MKSRPIVLDPYESNFPFPPFTQVSFNSNDGKQVKFMINDQSGQAKLDYYVDDHIKFPGLTSLTGKDDTIEFSAASNEDKIEEKTESVKLTSVSHEDVKRVLALLDRKKKRTIAAEIFMHGPYTLPYLFLSPLVSYFLSRLLWMWVRCQASALY